MRRWILPAAVALAATLLATPAAAQAAPDPAQAVKAQLRPERGVRVAEVSRTVTSQASTRTRYHSGIQLAPTGPVASWADVEDASDSRSSDGQGSKPGQRAAVGTSVYTSGEAVAEFLPKDKLWVRTMQDDSHPNLALAVASKQTINVFDPAVLKAALKGKRARAVSGGHLYQGTITYAQLYEADKAYYGGLFDGAPRGAYAKTAVSWRLWTDARGLPVRLSTTERARSGAYRTIDTRYSGWGEHLIITAPAKAEVVEWEERRRPGPDAPESDIGPSATHSEPYVS
ncbi:hypothetical protein OUY22_14900 [Nonomuraea sp. MCN248]|uniref:Uncharacterized protein n=1 Tax=Nonomuraea corallina TaxID=2989783 RepID=A0ABT4SCM3_9ACTN|nr:hypothetical protein [Nonomuraea corallina]MDA0634710.1 hypothetical protein [Nonomuraea corallina]